VTLLTELYPAIGIEKFCTVFGKTRQAWYYTKGRDQQQDMRDSLVVKMISEIREEQPKIGSRKLYHLIEPALELHGIKLGRDKLFQILQTYGLLVRYRKRKVITTNSNHPFYKYNNLIQNLVLRAKNQLWVSDITYISLKAGFCYLSLITDAFSRKIVGYCLWPTLAAQGCINALTMALEGITLQRIVKQLIHHSDRGVQYNGDPYQNAIAERVNGILKMEFGLNKAFDNIEKAVEAVSSAVDLYNSKRPHNSLNYLTPNQAHHLTGIIKRNWKNYKTPCITKQDKPPA